MGLKSGVEVARNDFLSEYQRGGRHGSKHPAGQGGPCLVLQQTDTRNSSCFSLRATEPPGMSDRDPIQTAMFRGSLEPHAEVELLLADMGVQVR